MNVADWPADLGSPLMEGYDITQREGFDTLKVANGPDRMRLRQPYATQDHAVRFLWSQDQVVSFFAFYQRIGLIGAFKMPLKRTEGPHQEVEHTTVQLTRQPAVSNANAKGLHIVGLTVVIR